MDTTPPPPAVLPAAIAEQLADALARYVVAAQAIANSWRPGLTVKVSVDSGDKGLFYCLSANDPAVSTSFLFCVGAGVDYTPQAALESLRRSLEARYSLDPDAHDPLTAAAESRLLEGAAL